MIIYHSWMDTDIDKWDTLSLEEPVKDKEEYYWSYDCLEIDSFYHFLECFGDLTKYDNILDFFPLVWERVTKGELPMI